MAYTKDERFLLCLYEAAKDAGAISHPFNKYAIGTAASLSPKGVDAICKLLLRANFIKKVTEEEIFLSSHGEKLAVQLLEQR